MLHAGRPPPASSAPSHSAQHSIARLTRTDRPVGCNLGHCSSPALRSWQRETCAVYPFTVLVREYRESDRVWAEPFMHREFGGPLQARRGSLLDVLALPGFVAERAERPIGLVTYRLEDDECELAFIGALERHTGVGTALLDALLRTVGDRGRIWLVTTNDNLEALRFYQRRGFVLSELRPGAVDAARQHLKPQISRVGDFGIPLRDELELELRPGGEAFL